MVEGWACLVVDAGLADRGPAKKSVQESVGGRTGKARRGGASSGRGLQHKPQRSQVTGVRPRHAVFGRADAAVPQLPLAASPAGARRGRSGRPVSAADRRRRSSARPGGRGAAPARGYLSGGHRNTTPAVASLRQTLQHRPDVGVAQARL